ncbi:MAG: NTP transferase domain-containing protein [Acidimicrobiia bacterium]
MPDVVAVILSGGRSSRMGSNKAHVEVAGRPMSAWVADALPASAQVVVAGHTPVGSHLRVDDAGGSGPLAGLAAAGRARFDSPASAWLVVAIDQPWLRRRTLQAIVDRFEERAVVPIADARRQVTCALYPMDLVQRAGDLAASGIGLQALLRDAAVDEILSAEWKEWGEDGRSWFSVDTPEDIERGLDRFGPPGEEPA